MHIIKVNLANNNITSDFNEELLNENLSKYLENSCIGYNIKNGITLQIKTQISKNEQEKTRFIINSYYQMQSKNTKAKILQIYKMRLILLVLGIIMIFISQLNLVENIRLISELLSIAGWVFIWELVYDIAFLNKKIKQHSNIIKYLSQANVEFV